MKNKFLIIVLLSCFSFSNLFSAEGIPAVAKSKKTLEEEAMDALENMDIGGLMNSFNSISSDISSVISGVNDKLSDFGFHQELYGVLFDAQCQRPNLDDIKVPDISGICEKIGNKVSGAGLFDKSFNIGPCAIRLSNNNSVDLDLSKWCKQDAETVVDKKGGWNGKKESTPVEIFSSSPASILSSKNIKGKPVDRKSVVFPSGLTLPEVDSKSSFKTMLNSKNDGVRSIVLDNDEDGYQRYRRYLTTVVGASEDKYNPIYSLPLPKNDEEYDSVVDGGAGTLMKITDTPELQKSMTTLLQTGYASGKYDSAVKKISKTSNFKKEFPDFKKKYKTFDKLENMADAKYRERAIFYYLAKSEKGEIATSMASADKQDTLHITLVESGLKNIESSMVEPYDGQLKKLPADLRYEFVKNADKDRFKRVYSKYLMSKIDNLRAKQKELALSSAHTAAVPFYPEVAYKELQKMLKDIH